MSFFKGLHKDNSTECSSQKGCSFLLHVYGAMLCEVNLTMPMSCKLSFGFRVLPLASQTRTFRMTVKLNHLQNEFRVASVWICKLGSFSNNIQKQNSCSQTSLGEGIFRCLGGNSSFWSPSLLFSTSQKHVHFKACP